MITFNKWIAKKIMESDEGLNIGNIIYIAVMLTREDQKKLYDNISSKVKIPIDWKKFCHHMTIRYVGKQPISDELIPTLGEEVSLVVTSYAADEKGVAVRVEPNTDRTVLKMPPEQLPHVTVAVAPGVRAEYSNVLLRKGIESIKPPSSQDGGLILHGYIGIKGERGIYPEMKNAAYESF